MAVLIEVNAEKRRERVYDVLPPAGRRPARIWELTRTAGLTYGTTAEALEDLQRLGRAQAVRKHVEGRPVIIGWTRADGPR